MFRWEEPYFFGRYSKEAYEEKRKTEPAHQDVFHLQAISKSDYVEKDLMAKVKRESDGEEFEFLLSYLECVDPKSEESAMLDLFSSWVVNY